MTTTAATGFDVEAIQAQRQQLEDDMKTEAATVESANDVLTEAFEKITVKPKKGNISLKAVALVWTK